VRLRRSVARWRGNAASLSYLANEQQASRRDVRGRRALIKISDGDNAYGKRQRSRGEQRHQHLKSAATRGGEGRNGGISSRQKNGIVSNESGIERVFGSYG